VTDASFNVEVTPDSAIEFAKLSGDWNPLRRSVARLPRPQVRCPDRATGHAAGGRSGREGTAAKVAHADRSPAGKLPSADDTAAQLERVLANSGSLASGATITLSGGALP